MLVCLHGLLCSGACWQGLLPRLRARYECRTLELPGLGAAPRLPHDDMSLPALTAWLGRELAALPAERVGLVASSWGGAVALSYAATEAAEARPRVAALALFAPVHPYWKASRRQRALLHPWGARLGAALLARAPTAWHRHFLAEMYGDAARLPPEHLAGYRERLRFHDLGRGVAGYGRTWRRDQQRLRPALSRVTAPTLLVWGDRDRAVPLESAEALRQALPRAELKVLPGFGHLPFEEDPKASAAAVLPFLDRYT